MSVASAISTLPELFETAQYNERLYRAFSMDKGEPISSPIREVEFMISSQIKNATAQVEATKKAMKSRRNVISVIRETVILIIILFLAAAFKGNIILLILDSHPTKNPNPEDFKSHGISA